MSMFIANITITLEVHAEPTPQVMQALENLAAVMAVQAEDGLAMSGNPDDDVALIGDDVEVENEHLGDITIRRSFVARQS